MQVRSSGQRLEEDEKIGRECGDMERGFLSGFMFGASFACGEEMEGKRHSLLLVVVSPKVFSLSFEQNLFIHIFQYRVHFNTVQSLLLLFSTMCIVPNLYISVKQMLSKQKSAWIL